MQIFKRRLQAQAGVQRRSSMWAQAWCRRVSVAGAQSQMCGGGRSRFPYRRKHQIFAGSREPLPRGRALEPPQFGERKSIILVGSTGAFDWYKNQGVGGPCSGGTQGFANSAPT